MKRFRFTADITADASDAEMLLSVLASHLAGMSRHLGNGHSEDAVCKHFEIEEVKIPLDAKGQPVMDGVVDLKDDHIVNKHGPADLVLDPNSHAAKSLAAQREREASERELARKARANEGKSDAEIMAEHRAKEEALDPANQ